MDKNFIRYITEAKGAIKEVASPVYHKLIENIDFQSDILASLEQTVYVMDLRTNAFTYLSENILKVNGYEKEEVVKMGPDKFMELWHEKDFNIIVNKIFIEGVNALKAYKDYEITKHRIAFNFRIRQKDGSYKMILNQLSHVLDDEERNPLVVLGSSSDISTIYNKNELFCRITAANKKGKWETIYERHFPTDESLIEDYGITPREFEVIKFVHDGLSSKEIASRFNRSEETIKSFRKSILAKTKCQSMTEVIVLATKNGWI